MAYDTDSHYTAVIEIHNSKRPATSASTPNPSVKREVARVVVRSKTLEDLVTQAGEHLKLIKDYG